MSSPFAIFRKHQRVMMAVVAVLAILAWLLIDTVGTQSGGGGMVDPVVATWRQGELHASDLQRMRDGHNKLSRFFELALMRTLEIQNLQGLSFQVPMVVQRLLGPATDEALVDQLLLAEQARKAGMVLSDDAVSAFIGMLTEQRVTGSELTDIARSSDLSRPELYNLIRGVLLAIHARQMYLPQRVATPAERWEYYKRLNQNATAEFLPVAVENFVGQVADPDQWELKEFFDLHKRQEPVPGSPEPGFKVPPKVSLEYVRADYERFLAQVTVTDEEVEAYYEQNQERFPYTDLGPGLDEMSLDAATDRAAPAAETPAEGASSLLTDGAASPGADAAAPVAETEATGGSETPAAETPAAETPAERSPPAADAPAADATDEEPGAARGNAASADEPAPADNSSRAGEDTPPAKPMPSNASPVTEEPATTVPPEGGAPAGTTEPTAEAPASEQPATSGPDLGDDRSRTPVGAGGLHWASYRTAREAATRADDAPGSALDGLLLAQADTPVTEQPAAEQPATEQQPGEAPTASTNENEPAVEVTSGGDALRLDVPADEAAESTLDEANEPTTPGHTTAADGIAAGDPATPADAATVVPEGVGQPGTETPATGGEGAATGQAPSLTSPGGGLELGGPLGTAATVPSASAIAPPPLGQDLILERDINAGENPQYDPLWKVSDQIRRELTSQAVAQKIDEVLLELQEKMRQYALERANRQFQQEQQGAEGTSTADLAPLDLRGMAESLGLSYAKIDDATQVQLRGDEGIVSSTVNGQSLAEYVFSDENTYRATRSEDAAGNRYLFWKTDFAPSYVPQLEEVRDEVVRVWKTIKARELAEKAASEMIAKARSEQKPLAELFGGEGQNVIEAGPFSWLTSGTAGMFTQQVPPELTAIPGVVDGGPRLMETVFSLAPGEVGQAMNEPRSIVYVIRVASLTPDRTSMRALFLAESFSNYIGAWAMDQQEAQQEWLESLREESRLTWVEPPADELAQASL